MRRLVALSCVSSMALGLCACGLTADFSGIQGGSLAPVDAGAEDGASAVTDAHTDVPVGMPEGGTEAGIDAGPPFCASLSTPVKLCDDFDEGAPVDAGWGATDTYGGEAIGLTTHAFSAPNAFSSAINPSGAPSSARLLQSMPTQSATVHVEFEMLLVPGDGTIELAAVHEVTADGNTYGLFLREVSGVLQMQLKTLLDDGGTPEHTWALAAPPSSWTRIAIDMAVSDSGTFQVQQDGVVVLSETNQPTSTPSRSAMFVELGLYSNAPATAQVTFDNAIVDWP